jgi:hypothetical protein
MEQILMAMAGTQHLTRGVSQIERNSQDASTSTKRKASLDLSKIKPDPDHVPSKRPRLASLLDSEGSVAYKRHPMHWYTDGSIVIRLKDVLFRLHRSRLTAQSTVFAALFDAPPDAELDVGEGETCNMYHIEGVRPRDFETLLDVLDDPSCVPPPCTLYLRSADRLYNVRREYMRPDLPFKTLSSLLRVTHALSYTKLHRWAAAQLETAWPASLSAFNAAPLPRALAALALAQHCGVPDARKRAYYELLRTPCFGADAEKKRESLDMDDYARLVRAREKCVEAWLGRKRPDMDGCPYDNAECLANEALAVRQMISSHDAECLGLFMYDPIAGLEYLCKKDWVAWVADAAYDDRSWCEGCVDEHREAWRKQRKQVWQGLDTWLELFDDGADG